MSVDDNPDFPETYAEPCKQQDCKVGGIKAFCVPCGASLCEDHAVYCGECGEALCVSCRRPFEEFWYCKRHAVLMAERKTAEAESTAAEQAMRHAAEAAFYFELVAGRAEVGF